MRILILGGTTEARLLCHALESQSLDHITFSLAGVTTSARKVPSAMRIGGFGGVAGLSAYLRDTRTEVVIDATHPFAAQMSRHAVIATQQRGVPLLRLARRIWNADPGSKWQHVTDISDVPETLGQTPRHVFLTTGRQDLKHFASTPHRYLLRCIDQPTLPLPPKTTLILARGPFTLEDEIALFRDHEINCLVTKNSGSLAIAPKLEAAQLLGVTVIMIDRPHLPEAEERETVDDALIWLQEIRRSV